MKHPTSTPPDGEAPTPLDLVSEAAFEAVDAFNLPDAAAETVISGIMGAVERDHAANAYLKAADRAPVDAETFAKKVRGFAGLVAMAYSARHDGRRRVAAPSRPTPLNRRTTRRGRSARLATNGRASGSRRSTTGTSSSSTDPGDGGESDPPGLGADTGKGEKGPRTCRGCGAPIDPSRRSDATLCPEPRKSACYRLAQKREEPRTVVEPTTAPAADFEPEPGRHAFGERQCRAAGWHPPHISKVARKVKAASSREAAARIVATWLEGCEHDLENGALTCRNCGRTVAGRTLGRTVPLELRWAMTTDGDGQPLNNKHRPPDAHAAVPSGSGTSLRDWLLFGGRADG